MPTEKNAPISSLKISELQLNDENPRTIREERFAHLVNSLIDFPEMMSLRPAVIDEANLVLGGNMRTRAKRHLLDMPEGEKSTRIEAAIVARAQQCQAEDRAYDEAGHRKLLAELFDSPTVPVTQALNLSEAQKREFIIKDNAGYGEWDWDALANGAWGDLPTLTAWGVDVPPKWAEDAEEQSEKEFDGPIETEHKCPKCGHEF